MIFDMTMEVNLGAVRFSPRVVSQITTLRMSERRRGIHSIDSQSNLDANAIRGVSMAVALPYHLSGQIEHAEDLVLMSPEKFQGQYNIDARVNQEIVSIDRANKEVEVKDLVSDQYFWWIPRDLLL